MWKWVSPIPPVLPSISLSLNCALRHVMTVTYVILGGEHNHGGSIEAWKWNQWKLGKPMNAGSVAMIAPFSQTPETQSLSSNLPPSKNDWYQRYNRTSISETSFRVWNLPQIRSDMKLTLSSPSLIRRYSSSPITLFFLFIPWFFQLKDRFKGH